MNILLKWMIWGYHGVPPWLNPSLENPTFIGHWFSDHLGARPRYRAAQTPMSPIRLHFPKPTCRRRRWPGSWCFKMNDSRAIWDRLSLGCNSAWGSWGNWTDYWCVCIDNAHNKRDRTSKITYRWCQAEWICLSVDFSLARLHTSYLWSRKL